MVPITSNSAALSLVFGRFVRKQVGAFPVGSRPGAPAGGYGGAAAPPPGKFFGFEATKWGVLRLFRAGFGWKLGANFTKGRAKLAKVVRKVRILGNSIR